MSSAIEEFAQRELGIKLTPVQLSIIKIWCSTGLVMQVSQRAGLSTCNKVIRAYIKAGLKGARLA